MHGSFLHLLLYVGMGYLQVFTAPVDLPMIVKYGIGGAIAAITPLCYKNLEHITEKETFVV